MGTWIIGASASCYFIMAAGLIGEHWRSFEHLDRRNARNSLYFECPNFHRNSRLIANNIITARLVIDIPNFDDLVFEYALKR